MPVLPSYTGNPLLDETAAWVQTCPRCLWPVARLGLCDTCEASDQARLRGPVHAPIPGAVPAPVRQMGSRQAEMAQRVGVCGRC